MRGFPDAWCGKESTCNAGGDAGLIPGQENPLGKELANPLQCYCLRNPMTEGPGGLEFMGFQRGDMTWQLNNNQGNVSLLSDIFFGLKNQTFANFGNI